MLQLHVDMKLILNTLLDAFWYFQTEACKTLIRVFFYSVEFLNNNIIKVNKMRETYICKTLAVVLFKF